MKLLNSTRFAVSGYLFLIIALFFYSFTQIDLSLTFSQASVLQDIQKGFQYIGYFNRPLSAQLFVVILLLLSVSYLRVLELIRKKKISIKTVSILILIVTILCTLTYNAFSYDLFNYIFDAKIVTQYQENPYVKKALDFPEDPMLSFMRWTHRTYPYGPVWLGLTVPLSYAGLQIFAVTFGLFKLLMAFSYVGCTYLIYSILKKIKPEYAVFGSAFFALNPLVLIESLVSAHNDIVMLFFALLSIFLLISKRYIPAILILSVSIGLKFATVFLLPVFIYVIYLSYKQKTIHWETVWYMMLFMMTLALLAVSFRTNFQPWYLLYLLPIASLISFRKYIYSPFIFLSVVALFNYLPFLYTGNWDAPIPLILNSLNMTAFVVAACMLLLLLKQERKKME